MSKREEIKLNEKTGPKKRSEKNGPKEEEPENGFVIEIPVFKSIWPSSCYNFHVDVENVNVQFTCKNQ